MKPIELEVPLRQWTVLGSISDIGSMSRRFFVRGRPRGGLSNTCGPDSCAVLPLFQTGWMSHRWARGFKNTHSLNSSSQYISNLFAISQWVVHHVGICQLLSVAPSRTNKAGRAELSGQTWTHGELCYDYTQKYRILNHLVNITIQCQMWKRSQLIKNSLELEQV